MADNQEDFKSNNTSYNTEESNKSDSAPQTPSEQVKTPKKPSKLKFALWITIIFVILPLLIGCVLVVLAAINYGKGNSLSKLANFIPIEKVDWLDDLRGDEDDMLKDSVKSEVENALNIKDKSPREFKGQIDVNGSYEIQNGPTSTFNLQLEGVIALASDSLHRQYDLKIAGNHKTGILNIDLGSLNENTAVSASIIQDLNNYYLLFNFSEDLLNILKFANQDFEIDGSRYFLSDLSNQYAKIDLNKLLQTALSNTALENVKAEDLIALLRRYEGEIRSELSGTLLSTLFETTDYLSIDPVRRERVSGTLTVVYSVELDQTKFRRDLEAAIEESLIKISSNVETLEEICRLVTEDSSHDTVCKTSSSDFNFTSDQKEEISRLLRDFMEYIDINSIEIYIRPDNFEVDRLSVEIKLSEKGQSKIAEATNSQINMKHLTLRYNLDIKRTGVRPIEKPLNSFDISEMLGNNTFPEPQVAVSPVATPIPTPTAIPNPNDKDKFSVLIDGNPVLGDKKTATIAIVEFTDYECPYCKELHDQVFPQIKKKLIDTGKAIYVTKEFPLNIHKNAYFTAVNAKCAYKTGDDAKYYAFREEVLKQIGTNKDVFTAQSLAEISKAIGIDESQFTSCINSVDAQDLVDLDILDGDLVGIEGTPGFVIGELEDNIVYGKVYTGSMTYEEFMGLIP